MTFTVIDWVFFIIILIFCITALIKGFINELFGKASFIVGIIMAIFFYSKVAKMMNSKIQSIVLCNVLAFILIFAVVFLVLKLVGSILHKIFELSLLKGLDRAFGAMFGLVEGFAIVCLVMFLLTIQPFFDASSLLEGSFFHNMMNTYIPEVKAAIANV